MNSDKPIGVFDSGIGGLSVLKQFIRFLPYEKYIYLGDTARVPYGNKSSEIIKDYSRDLTDFMMSFNVKLIVAACNSVSSVALDVVSKFSGVPVIGMIIPAVAAALRATQSGRIGIIGTRATIGSNAYVHTINEMKGNTNIEVFSKACPLFVPLVEEGWVDHPATQSIAEEYLKEFNEKEIDTLILGCTHYPLLRQLITDIMPGVALIDSGEHSAVTAIRTLGSKGELAPEKHEFMVQPDIKFYFTDVPSTFNETAGHFLGFPIESPQKAVFGQAQNI